MSVVESLALQPKSFGNAQQAQPYKMVVIRSYMDLSLNIRSHVFPSSLVLFAYGKKWHANPHLKQTHKSSPQARKFSDFLSPL